jgi:ubiquinone/menaquinone biosynthesis C-methylase UbiE
MTGWENIWKAKKYFLSDNQLESLVKTNGFDSAYVEYKKSDWMSMCEKINTFFNLDNSKNILEIGCGSGALVYGLSSIQSANFYGIDYSDSLIEIAKAAMPKHSWTVAESQKIPFPNEYFDFVIIHSVLQYMPNIEYFKKTMLELQRVCKTGGTILIADIYDKDKINEYYELRSKRSNQTVDEYKNNNKNLPHMFYTKNQIFNQLKSVKAIKEINIFPKNDKNLNSFYSFSVLGIKK